MDLSRFTIVAICMALMAPLVSSATATTDYSHPQFSVTEDPALSLRETGSQIVMKTIEDALRQGGVALLGEGFHLDSSLNYVFGGGENNITGEADLVIPLLGGTKQVVFLQPGVVFWTGLEDEERTDGNIGLVYRAATFGGDVVTGFSVFYDHNLQAGHSRLSGGMDFQSGWFRTSLNYYHPLSDTENGREGYVEDALQGADVRFSLESEMARIGGNVGYWKFQGNDTVEDVWNPSFGADLGLRILPGIFLEGGWERHDEEVSFEERWNVGFAFRFSLPDFEGASYGNGEMSTNLYKIVDREKRILYEEREAAPPVRLRPVDENGMELSPQSFLAEGDTVTIVGELEALLVPTTLEIVVNEDASSADLGTDFSYGHEVYVLNEATGQQSPPGTVTDCPETTCEMMIPAGVTRFDIEIEILTDNAPKEIPEEVVLQVNVPEEHQGMIQGGETTVTIQAKGNTVQFASAESTLNENPNTPEGTVAVSVDIDLPSPTPITLNVETGGTATEGADRDYTISTRSLMIPANADSASLTLTGIDNDVGDGSKTIELTLSGDLPDGWAFGSQTTHTVTLQDDDLSVFVVPATPRTMEEPADGAGASTRMITVGITQQPPSDVSVTLSAMGATQGTATSGDDFTFADATVMFSQTASELTVTRDITIADDSDPEGDETIILTLTDPTGSLDGTGFSLADPYTITIPANDNTVGFASSTSTLGEQDTANIEVSVGSNLPSPITLNIATGGNAMETRDYTISSPSNKRLVIPAEESSGTITLAGVDDDDSPSSTETIELTISVEGSLPPGWTLGTQTMHTVTLQDDDLDLSVGFVSSSNTVDEPASDTDYTVDITISQAPATTPVTLQISRASASTTDMNGSDVTFSPSSVTFMPGGPTSKTVTLNVKHDTEAEGTEFIELELGDDSGNSRTSGDNMFSFGIQKYRLNINASDNTVGFVSNAAATLGEDGGTANVEVSISNPAPVDITLNIATGGTADEGMDYENLPDSLTIQKDQTSGTIVLTSINDRRSEGNEDITLTLSVVGNLPDGWIEGDLEHEVTLQDDDLSIGFAEASETIDEPASDTDYTVDITISRAPATTPVTLQISRAAVSTADTTGSNIDVTFSPSSVTFMPGGSTSETVTLNVKHDTVPEDAEFIELELGDSGNTRMSGGNMFNFGTQKYRLNINASDTITVGFLPDRHQTEGGTVSRPEIEVSPAFSQNLKVNVKVSDDSTADPGDDYTDNIPSSVTILPNNSGWNINVDVIDDGDDEITETVILEIEEPSGADEWPPGVILDQSKTRHVFSIFDNDVPANTIGFNTVLSETTAIEGAGEFNTGSANLELEVAQGLPSAVSVTVTVSGVSNPNDYVFYIFPPMSAPERNPNPNNVLSIPMGARNFPFILAAPEDGDTNDENITLTLSSSNLPSGWSFGSTNSPNSWMLEIEDND